MRLATFNVQNLRLRQQPEGPALDGAMDLDPESKVRTPDLDRVDRQLGARVIVESRADIVALQEVFDRAALDHFHDSFLRPAGAVEYPYRVCLPGNDGRGRNVAVLSRREPLAVESHASLTGSELGLDDLPPDLRDRPLFRRDCLELQFGGFSLFVCHFKAPYPDARKAHAVRMAEARGLRTIIERRFVETSEARWVVAGDFNEPARPDGEESALAPLRSGFAVDLMDRLSPDKRWTYEVPETHLLSRPDRIFVSPRLAREFPETRPEILRSGMAKPTGETESRPHASDHALVVAAFPGL